MCIHQISIKHKFIDIEKRIILIVDITIKYIVSLRIMNITSSKAFAERPLDLLPLINLSVSCCFLCMLKEYLAMIIIPTIVLMYLLTIKYGSTMTIASIIATTIKDFTIDINTVVDIKFVASHIAEPIVFFIVLLTVILALKSRIKYKSTALATISII